MNPSDDLVVREWHEALEMEWDACIAEHNAMVEDRARLTSLLADLQQENNDRAAREEKLRKALEKADDCLARFRAAKAWISANAWDSAPDTRAKLEDADSWASYQFGPMTDNEIATVLSRMREPWPAPTDTKEPKL